MCSVGPKHQRDYYSWKITVGFTWGFLKLMMCVDEGLGGVHFTVEFDLLVVLHQFPQKFVRLQMKLDCVIRIG